MRKNLKSGIYCIHNIVNGKRYIGQSVDWKGRNKGELTALRGGYFHNSYMQASWIKYGETNFEWSLLEMVPVSMLDIRECAWIEYYDTLNPKNGYNFEGGGNAQKVISLDSRKKMSLARKGQQNSLGRVLSEATKQKIANSLKGRHLSEAHREKIRKKMLGNQHTLGRHHTDEARRKIVEALRGRVISAETRVKLSNAQKGREHSWIQGHKCSLALRGRTTSLESRQKMSDEQRRVWTIRKQRTTRVGSTKVVQ